MTTTAPPLLPFRWMGAHWHKGKKGADDPVGPKDRMKAAAARLGHKALLQAERRGANGYYIVFGSYPDWDAARAALELVPPGDRHVYELLPADSPVKPYMDVDCDELPAGFPDVASVAARVRGLTAAVLKTEFGADVADSDVVVTHSPNQKKACSLHVVVSTRAPQLLFRRAEDARSLAALVAARFPDCGVDVGVYTRDRAMRLCGATKSGKRDSALRVLGADEESARRGAIPRDAVVTWLDDEGARRFLEPPAIFSSAPGSGSSSGSGSTGASAPSQRSNDDKPKGDTKVKSCFGDKLDSIREIGMLLSRLSDRRADDRDCWMRVGFAVRRHEAMLVASGRKREAEGMRELFHAFSRRSNKFPGSDAFHKDYASLVSRTDGEQVTIATLHMWADEDDPRRPMKGPVVLADEAFATAIADFMGVRVDSVRDVERRNDDVIHFRTSKGPGSLHTADLAAFLGNACLGSVAAGEQGAELPLPETFALDVGKYYSDCDKKKRFGYTRSARGFATIVPFNSGDSYPQLEMMAPHTSGSVVTYTASEGDAPRALAADRVSAWNADLQRNIREACEDRLGQVTYMAMVNHGTQIVVNNHGVGSDPESTNGRRMLALEDRLLDDAKRKRLRKLDGVVYSPLPGRPCAYVPGFTYKRHISRVFKTDRDLRAAPENVSRLEKFLVDHVDLDAFPELEPNMHLVSFDNGVLDIVTMQFTQYDEIDTKDDHPMRSEVARHHIALPWTGRREAPNLMRVMDHQFESAAVKRLLCALMGRTLFQVRELDNWEAVPFLFGAGGTGKSLVLGTLKRLFRERAVWELASQADGHFSLQGLLGAEMALGTDMPAQIEKAISQVDLQKMCSGEAITVNIKGKGPQLVPAWKAPLAFASNYEPQWANAGDCVGRRLVPFRFANPVTKRDVDLVARIGAELPEIMCCFLHEYHELRRRVGAGGDVHENLPPEVREWRGEVRSSCSKLFEFLSMSDEMRVITEKTPGQFIPDGNKYMVCISRELDAYTPKDELRKWYRLWLGQGRDRDASFCDFNETDFSLHGFMCPVGGINMCKSCHKRSKSKCCSEYSPTNRRKQLVIEHMKMDVVLL